MEQTGLGAMRGGLRAQQLERGPVLLAMCSHDYLGLLRKAAVTKGYRADKKAEITP